MENTKPLRQCKAILIDPAEATVSLVDYNGDYNQLYRLLSSPWHKVETFTVVHLNDEGDALYVDDDGLLHEPLVPHWFTWKGYAQPLAGRGVILGVDDEGDSISPKVITPEIATKHVTHLARLGDMLIGIKDKSAVAYRVPKAFADVIFPYPVPKGDQN